MSEKTTPIYSEQLDENGLRTVNHNPQPPQGWAEHEKLIVATVPHTGTKALKKALSQYYPEIQDFPHRIKTPERKKTKGRELVVTHFRRETKKIIKLPWPKITPIRDPMLTVITQAARKKYMSHKIEPKRIINSWKLFIELYPLVNIVRVEDIADEWVTSTQKFELHEAYENGDFDYVKKMLKGDTWDQIVALGPQLKPIFDKEGYSFPWLN